MIGFGGYQTAPKLKPFLDENVNINAMLSESMSPNTTVSSRATFNARNAEPENEFNITEIILNSPIGENAETIDVSEFQEAFMAEGIDISEIFGENTVLNLTDLSEQDLQNLEEFADQAEAADVDVEAVALEHIS